MKEDVLVFFVSVTKHQQMQLSKKRVYPSYNSSFLAHHCGEVKAGT